MNLPYLKQVVGVCFITILSLCSMSLSAQNGKFDVRFVVKNYNCATSKVTLLLQVKSPVAGSNFLMGDANYRFDYDPRIISNPTISSQEGFSGISPANDPNYGVQTLNGSSAGPTLGTVSLNTFYGQGGLNGRLVTPTWASVSCLTFDMLNPDSCISLIWHTDNDFPVTGMNEVILTKDSNGNPTGIYDLKPVPADGIFTNYKLCGNLVCSSMIAVDDINITKKGTPVSGNAITNDISNGGTPLVTITPLGGPTNGTITFKPDGTYTYTPNPTFIGKDPIKYKVCNPAGNCDSATLTITVIDSSVTAGKLVPPIASNDAYIGPINTPIKGNARNNDVSFNNDTLVYKTTPLVTPKNGSVVLNADGTFVYTPTNSFVGKDSFRYKISEKKNPTMCDSAWVILTILPNNTGGTVVNNAPVAVDDYFTTKVNVPILATVKLNDSDPDSTQTLTYTTTPVSPPTHGTVVLNADGTFKYTPTMGYTGTDQFVYKVCDNGLPILCAQATDYITITPESNYKPHVTVTPTTVPGDSLSKKCFAIQDSNATQTHTVTACTPPAHGTVGAVVVDNTTTPHQVCITYTPTLYYNGPDTVCVIVCDNGAPTLCDTVKITYTVTPVNHPPVVVIPPITTKGDTTITVCTTITNPDNKTKTYTATTCPGFPKNGTATPVVTGNQLCITYTPTLLFSGKDTVCVTVCDSTNACTTVKVPVTVTPVNHKPVVLDSAIATPFNSPITVCLPVKDPDSLNTNTVTLCGAPKNGGVSTSTNNTTTPRQVCVTYTPLPTFSGKDTICITTCDNGTPQLCATTKIFVTVALPPKPPVAVNDFNNTIVNTPVSGTILDNDSDPNGLPLTVTTTPLKSTKNGTITLTAAGGYTYTPNTGFVGKDTAQYKVCNNGTPVQCDSAYILLTVTPLTSTPTTPLKPVANEDFTVTPKNTPIKINVKANDYSPQGGTLGQPTILGTPTNGTVVVNSDGTVTFTPTPGFVGKGIFKYVVCDNKTPQQCDTAGVTVVVIDSVPPTKNLPPTAVDDANQTPKNVPVTGSVATNDSDPNTPAQTLTFSLLTTPTNGSVTLQSNGTYTYTPKKDYTGPDNFKYIVCDNGVPTLCDTATAHIVVFDNPCVTISLKVLLEGPFDSIAGKMRTILNQRGLLPGQTPIGTFAVKTPKGQPYNKAPWNYAGTEADTVYAADVVDWVLVSLTPDTSVNSAILKAAGLLHSDGTVTFTTPCFNIPIGNYRVAVEHRNHMGVLSASKVSVTNSAIFYDFTTADSYIATNPPSFGQKLVGGKYVMYGGEGQKSLQKDNYDINFADSQLWKTESGIFDQYRTGDFNLDADVNFADQVLWKKNSGKYSAVIH